MGVIVVALFGLGVWGARLYGHPIQALLGAYPALGIAVFFASSVLAVLVPVLTNLPLLPLAVMAYGPVWTALILLTGWVLGAALSFALGRHARALVLRRFPGMQRHGEIERLIHPRQRLWSLVLLRVTFPVDVLSYALGMFSPRTSALENAASTALGAAPFAVVFALFPTLSGASQWIVFGASVLVFLIYTTWMLHRPP